MYLTALPKKPQRRNTNNPEALSASEGSGQGIPACSSAWPEAQPLTGEIRNDPTTSPCLPSRRCLCRPSVLCVPSSPHNIAFRPNTVSVSVASNHTHAFRLHNTVCECHLPSHSCLPSRRCLWRLSIVCVPSSPHNIAFRPNTVGECYLPSHPCLPSRRCLCRPSFRCVPSHHHTTFPSVPRLSVSVTSHHTHAFRPNAACADRPSFAFHHDNKAMPSVPTPSVS